MDIILAAFMNGCQAKGFPALSVQNKAKMTGKK
jgi:hypothetical protein